MLESTTHPSEKISGFAHILMAISLAAAGCTKESDQQGPSATDQYERATSSAFEGGLKLQEEKRKAQIEIMRRVNTFLVQDCRSPKLGILLSGLMDSIAENDQSRTRLFVRTLGTYPEGASLASEIEPLLDMAFAH